MVSAFFESIKYVGHYFPVAFLRIYIGYHYLSMAIDKVKGDFLIQPRLAAEISEWLPQSIAPLWYKSLIEQNVIENWRVVSYFITYCEFLIGLSFLLGFFVRPVSLLGIFISINYMFTSQPAIGDLNQIFMMLFIVMFWLGAGRCIGFDYFFFKRQRGIWW